MTPKPINDNAKIYSIPDIKEALVKACINSRPNYFKRYLDSNKVICEPDKEGFINSLNTCLQFLIRLQ